MRCGLDVGIFIADEARYVQRQRGDSILDVEYVMVPTFVLHGCNSNEKYHHARFLKDREVARSVKSRELIPLLVGGSHGDMMRVINPSLVECPLCEAAVGDGCFNLGLGPERRRDGYRNKSFHKQRVRKVIKTRGLVVEVMQRGFTYTVYGKTGHGSV